MNILLFIIPKNDTAYLYDDFTVRQALEKMEHHGYSAIPIISREGKYVGTLTEGDLLWAIKNRYQLDIRGAEQLSIMQIHRKADSEPVTINTKMEDLVMKAMHQNFIPIIDDRGVYIGIITRKAIIKYFYDKTCADSVAEEK